MIRLNWGMLYSAYVSQDSLKRIRLHDFPDNLMTSSVLAFDLLVKTNDLLKVDSDFWRESDYACVLNSVEAVHWHAYLFNKEYSIRSRLSQIGFMANRPVSSGYTLPHLLEQEILSIEIVVAIVYRFYGHSPSCQIYDNHFDNTLKRYD